MNFRERELTNVLENIPGTTEHELRKIKRNMSSLSLLTDCDRVPDCRVRREIVTFAVLYKIFEVCMEKFQRGGQIFSCTNGHFLCGACKSHSSIKVEISLY